MTSRLYGRKRARAAVWVAVVAFVGSTVALNVLLDSRWSHYRDPEFTWHARHTAKRQTQEPNREIGVVLGSSRPQFGFDPDQLKLAGPDAPMVANFAQTGCVPVYALMNLRRLLARGMRPAFVLIEIMPVVLVANVPAETLIPTFRISYADSRTIRDYCDDPDAWSAQRIAPFHSYRVNILTHHAPSLIPDSANLAWMWTRPGPSGWLSIGIDEIPQARRDGYMVGVKASYEQAFTNFEIAPRSDKAVREMLEICREQSIPVAGLWMPESQVFRSWYQPDFRGKITAYLELLRRDYDFTCFDCSTWLEETDFLDGHHLLAPGAAKFSRRFGAECLQPWLESLKRKKAATP